MGNARAAVAISNGGTNWRPWCTAWSDAACGTKGGSYLGRGAPYQAWLQTGVTPDYSAPINGTNAAGNVTGAGGNPTPSQPCDTWDWFIDPGLCTGSQAGNTAYLTSGGYKIFGLPILPKGGIGQLGNQFAGGPGAAAQLPGQAVNYAAEHTAAMIIRALVGGVINPMIQLVAGGAGIVGGAVLMIAGIYVLVKNTQTGQEAISGAKSSVGALAWLAGPEAGVAEEGMAAGTSKRQSMRVGGFQTSRTQYGPRPPRASSPSDQINAEAARLRAYSSAMREYRMAGGKWQ